MSERLKFQGRLLEKDQEKRKTEVLISGLIWSLRELLDPTEHPDNLRPDVIADQALRLSSAVIELRKILAEIREIKRLLTE